MPLKKIPVLKLVLVIRNKSVQDLATHVGVARPYVSTWVNGHDEPNIEQAKKIADFLKWNLADIWEDEAPVAKRKRATTKVGKQKLVTEDALKVSENIVPFDRYLLAKEHGLDPVESIEDADGMVGIPLWSESIAATDLQQNHAAPDQRWVYYPKSLGKKLRAVEIHGDSMNKVGIEPGDILFVRLLSDPAKAQGEVCIISTHEGATLKRVKGRRGVPESTRYHPDVSIGPDARFAVAVAIHKKSR